MAKFSKLLQGDVAEFSPSQAGAAFSTEAARLVREEGLDLSAAWKKTKILHPETHARLCEGAQPNDTLANDATIPAIPAGWKEFSLPAFHLPATTTEDEFSAVWKANGGTVSPLNAGNVFLALIVYTARKQKVSVAIARRTVLGKFPALAFAARQTV